MCFSYSTHSVGEFIELPHIEEPSRDTVEYWNEEIRQGIAAIQERHS